VLKIKRVTLSGKKPVVEHSSTVLVRSEYFLWFTRITL